MMYFLPDERLEYEIVTTCPLCGADLMEAREMNTRTHYLHDLSEGIEIVRCVSCGLVLQRRRLAASQWETFNSSYPSDGSLGWEDGDNRFREEIARIRQYCPEGSSILDVGCGFGELTNLLRDTGFAAEGVDPRADALAFGREHHGLTLHAGFYDSRTSGALGERFQAIVSIHAFEHFQNPLETLRLMSGNLVPGGTLFLTVPDITPPLRDPGIKPFDFYTPGHLLYYEPSTLETALRVAGFEPLAVERDFDGTSEKPILRCTARKAIPSSARPRWTAAPLSAGEIEAFQAGFLRRREEAVLRNLALGDSEQVAVYGTWLYGLIALHAIEKSGRKVVSVVDSDPGKWGHLFAAHVIAPPEDLRTACQPDAVAVTSVNGFGEICRLIRGDLGLKDIPVHSIAGGLIR